MTRSPDTVVTPEVTVTEAHLVGWAGLTGDWFPHHMSAEFAAESSFGARVAHGPLTLALALGLGTRTPLVDPQRVLAWLGLREVHAVAPVYIGDTIHAELRCVSARPTEPAPNHVVELEYRVLNQDRATVMTFVSVLLTAER